MKRAEAVEEDMEEKSFGVNHVLANPEHFVIVYVDSSGNLMQDCQRCDWWDNPIQVKDVDKVMPLFGEPKPVPLAHIHHPLETD